MSWSFIVQTLTAHLPGLSVGVGGSSPQLPPLQEVPIAPEPGTPFVIFSAAKAMTAALAHLLTRDGLVHAAPIAGKAADPPAAPPPGGPEGEESAESSHSSPI